MNNIINNLIKNIKLFKFYNYNNKLNIIEREITTNNIKLSTKQIEQYNNNNIYLRNFVKKNVIFNEFQELYSIFDNEFISYEISKFIIDNIKYKCLLNSKDYNITIYFYNKNKNLLLINEILNIVKYCKIILKINKPINLIIYLTPLKKKFNKILNINNINSGSTNRENIWIFREEELLKIIIHELIHYSNYDINNDSYLNKLILSKIKLLDNTSFFSINEAYTESLAILLFIFYLTLKKFKKFNLNYYNKLLNIEIKWSILQSAKILYYNYNFNKLENMYMNNNIYQNTDIVSYYIIKSALLFNYKYFFDFLDSNTTNCNFNDNINNYNNFYSLVFKCLDCRNFNNIVNNIIKKFSTNNLLIKSMRMSYLS